MYDFLWDLFWTGLKASLALSMGVTSFKWSVKLWHRWRRKKLFAAAPPGLQKFIRALEEIPPDQRGSLNVNSLVDALLEPGHPRVVLFDDVAKEAAGEN